MINKKTHSPLGIIYCLLILGSVFFVSGKFVNEYFTPPQIWMAVILAATVVVFTKIYLPPSAFLLLLLIWLTYRTAGMPVHTTTAYFEMTLWLSAFLVLYNLLLRPSIAKTLFGAWMLAGLLAAGMGVWQWMQLFSANGSFTITGPFDNPAGISALLAGVAPLFIGSIAGTNQKHQKIFLALGLVLCIAVVWATQARAAILATMAALVAGVAVADKRVFVILAKYKKILLPIAVIFVALSATALYWWKAPSANGRLIIWKNTLTIIAQEPLWGYGQSGFYRAYMPQQAVYFSKNSSIQTTAMLAGNVRHPFNEYLKEIAEYGIVGFLLSTVLIGFAIYHWHKRKDTESIYVLISLGAIGICALFSYPLDYPAVRLLALCNIAFLLKANARQVKPCTGRLLLLLPALAAGYLAWQKALPEIHWKTVATQALQGTDTAVTMPKYRTLYSRSYLKNNALFLYNYAAESFMADDYATAIRLLHECLPVMDDYPTRLLLGDCYLQSGNYAQAEKHLRTARNMIPSRFVPPYKLATLYLQRGDTAKAVQTATQILRMPVKVNSLEVAYIQAEMQQLVNDHTNKKEVTMDSS